MYFIFTFVCIRAVIFFIVATIPPYKLTPAGGGSGATKRESSIEGLHGAAYFLNWVMALLSQCYMLTAYCSWICDKQSHTNVRRLTGAHLLQIAYFIILYVVFILYW